MGALREGMLWGDRGQSKKQKQGNGGDYTLAVQRWWQRLERRIQLVRVTGQIRPNFEILEVQ